MRAVDLEEKKLELKWISGSNLQKQIVGLCMFYCMRPLSNTFFRATLVSPVSTRALLPAAAWACCCLLLPAAACWCLLALICHSCENGLLHLKMDYCIYFFILNISGCVVVFDLLKKWILFLLRAILIQFIVIY